MPRLALLHPVQLLVSGHLLQILPPSFHLPRAILGHSDTAAYCLLSFQWERLLKYVGDAQEVRYVNEFLECEA